MLDVRRKNAHTKDNDDHVYRVKDTEFIRLLEKAIPARFDESHKERPEAAHERYGLR